MGVANQQELRDERESLIRAHLDAERSADPSAILATFTHPRYELVGAGRVYEGAAEVRRYLEERRKIFPDLHTELIEIWHADDMVVAELWLMGTHRGEIADVAASGRSFRCRTACFFEFAGSGLVGVRAYFDLGTIARQLA